METKGDETRRAPGEPLMLFSHQSSAGLPCEGGWAEAQPVAPNETLRYRCRACGALMDQNDPALGRLGRREFIEMLTNGLQPVCYRILQASLRGQHSMMVAAIRQAPAGTVPFLLILCDLEGIMSSELCGEACFQSALPRSAVPPCLGRTADEILASYDSAATASHLGLRCLTLVQILYEGQLWFDQPSVVFLNEGPAPGAYHANKAETPDGDEPR